jgi:hypothetical protein
MTQFFDAPGKPSKVDLHPHSDDDRGVERAGTRLGHLQVGRDVAPGGHRDVVEHLRAVLVLLVPALPWILIVWVWAYNLVWMVFLDTVKLMFYWAMETQDRSLWSLFRHYAAPVRPVASRPTTSAQPRRAGLGLSVNILALLLGLLGLLAWDFARG